MSDYCRPFHEQLLEQVLMAVEEVSETGLSKGIVLIGDSGVGKTHAFDHLFELFPSRTEGNQVVTSAVRASLGTTATASSISKSLLIQLGRPLLPKEKLSVDDHELLLFNAIRGQRTRLVLLEEVHNGLLSTTTAIKARNRHFLKNLWNMHNPNKPSGWVTSSGGIKPWGLVIVLSATSELKKPLAEHSELTSRYSSVINAPSLALFPATLLDEFRRVLKTMLKRYGLSERASVNDRNFVAQVFFATNGHLRNLNDLLQRCSSLAKKADAPTTMSALLAIAFEQVGGGYVGEDQNPFNWTGPVLHNNVLKVKLKQKSSDKGATS